MAVFVVHVGVHRESLQRVKAYLVRRPGKARNADVAVERLSIEDDYCCGKEGCCMTRAGGGGGRGGRGVTTVFQGYKA